MPGSEKLIQLLITQSEKTEGKLGEVADRLGDLIGQESARMEREKIQVEKNQKYDGFVKEFNDDHVPVLRRARRTQERIDKALDGAFTKIVTMAVIAVGAILGFNWLG